MSSGTAQFLAATSAGEVLLITAALGWFARRGVRSLDRLRDKVTGLSEVVTVMRELSPGAAATLAQTAEVVTEHSGQIAVLAAWQANHDRYHERQDVRR